MHCAPFKLLVRSKLGNEKTFNKFTVLYKNNTFIFVREIYSWFYFVLCPNLQPENMNFNTVLELKPLINIATYK